MPSISIDDIQIEVSSGKTILEAAREAGIYIPTLCSHPDMKPFRSIQISENIFQGDKIYENDEGVTIESIKGCGICVVRVKGEEMPVPSCRTLVEKGMVIYSDTEDIRQKRRQNLIPILARHPHACLTCSQRDGCITTTGDCSNSVPMNERCCELNGNCELQRLCDYMGIAPETPKFIHPGIPRIEDDGLFIRDYNLCIACGRCVRACQQLRNVYALGAVIKEGKLIIGTVNGSSLPDALCRFCGACVEVCPTGALQEKKKPRLKDVKDYVPCQANCPANVEIPLYLKLIADGEYQKAAEVIASRLSFPNSLGKICFHPCETECRRNELSEALNNIPGAISIRLAKDFAMSRIEKEIPDIIAEPSGKKIAIIGAGPAGLTAGFYLSLKGHKVTVFEKEEKIGGMLRYGIPRYRLSEETLEKDLHRLLQSGMEIRTNVSIGADFGINSLLNDGYDAVYLAVGLSKSKHLPISVPENSNIHYGIEFLNSVTKGRISNDYFKYKNVIVIGGGNVATDTARTTVRLGADKTTIVCLEKANEMPAYKDEINEALDEGIEILNEWGIAAIQGSNDSGLLIKLKKCVSVFDENGAFSPEYDESTLDSISGNAVIICVGQEVDKSFLLKEEKQSIFYRGLVIIKNGTAITAINGLFAGGDIVSGPASVIEAVGKAKHAAREIDSFLSGDGVLPGDIEHDYKVDPKIGKLDGFCYFERKEPQLLDAAERKDNFHPVEFSFDEQNAREETARCLQCNLRLLIRYNPFPPVKYLEFSYDNIETIAVEEGVVQLLNKDKEVFLIKGSQNMRETLINFYEEGKEAGYFTFEPDKLYSKRESELIQQYLQKHGEMPDSGDDLDDLF